tara:strand:+ start:6740 stop:7204 length:465 start_codon:yes stop_codon:yes gene_type:complete
MTEKAHIIKLSNGEDIIVTLIAESKESITITDPLRMRIFSRPTKDGMVESMSLGRWIEPFSEKVDYNISKNQIITLAPASFAMKRYYDYILLTSKEHLTDVPEIPKSEDDEVKLVNERLKVLQEYVDSIKDEEEDNFGEDDLFDLYDEVSDKIH